MEGKYGGGLFVSAVCGACDDGSVRGRFGRSANSNYFGVRARITNFVHTKNVTTELLAVKLVVKILPCPKRQPQPRSKKQNHQQ
jgi:hypothetical protein